MKKIVIYLFCVICLFSCKKNEYLNASIDEPTVEFASTALNETIPFVTGSEYTIAVPIHIFGGNSTASLSVKAETKMSSDAYSVANSVQLNGKSLDTIFVKINTKKLEKGTDYNLKLTISSSNVTVSKNYESCTVTFSQQAFMDFFTGTYSCYESSTGATYNVEFVKQNNTTIKNMNFYDFPLAGQYVPYVFTQDESMQVEIPENTEWTDNLGNKYLVSGTGTYELNGNFAVDFTMKDAATEEMYMTGKHTFRKK